jgi:hypothetical protein
LKPKATQKLSMGFASYSLNLPDKSKFVVLLVWANTIIKAAEMAAF